jgi:hypothetical protein
MSTNPVEQSLVAAEAAIIEQAKDQVAAEHTPTAANAAPETAGNLEGYVPSTLASHTAGEAPAPDAPVTRQEFDLMMERFTDLINRVQDFNRRSGQKI